MLLNLSNDSENKSADVLDVKLAGLVNYYYGWLWQARFFRFLSILWYQRNVVFRIVSRQDNILVPVTKDRIAQYILSNNSQSMALKLLSTDWINALMYIYILFIYFGLYKNDFCKYM